MAWQLYKEGFDLAVLQETLRTASTSETGTSNALGDKQLVADVAADRCADEDALEMSGCMSKLPGRMEPPVWCSATTTVWLLCSQACTVTAAPPQVRFPALASNACSCVFDALHACGAVELASSEEAPSDHELGGSGCAAQMVHWCARMLLHLWARNACCGIGK